MKKNVELEKSKKEFEEQKIMPRVIKSGSIGSDSINHSTVNLPVATQTIKVIRKKTRAQSIQPKSIIASYDDNVKDHEEKDEQSLSSSIS